MKAILLVGIGGFFGSAFRYSLSVLLGKQSWWSGSIPPTFLVNILGCFLIGLLMGWSARFSKELMLIVATGFCGGFTTFSTFSLESMQFLHKGDYRMALIYIFSSVLIGLFFTILGFWISKSL